MSDKTTILRAFNTHFFAFVDDIISIFPELIDLQQSKVSFETMKRANPTAIIKAWYRWVYLPYITVIQSGDITFFFKKDYSSDLAHLKNSDNIMTIINSLRDPIGQMSETNKAHSMKYIQNLCKLSIMYNE